MAWNCSISIIKFSFSVNIVKMCYLSTGQIPLWVFFYLESCAYCWYCEEILDIIVSDCRIWHRTNDLFYCQFVFFFEQPYALMIIMIYTQSFNKNTKKKAIKKKKLLADDYCKIVFQFLYVEFFQDCNLVIILSELPKSFCHIRKFLFNYYIKVRTNDT